MCFIIRLISTSEDRNGDRKGNKREPELELFCFPAGDISCSVYQDQPCSCYDTWGQPDPCMISLSSLTSYTSLPANRNPDVMGQYLLNYDHLSLI